MWPQCQNNACLFLACISFCHKFHFFVSEINRLLWNFLQYFLHLCYECSCPAASISLTSTHFSIFFIIMSCIYNRSPLLRISWQAFLRQFWHRFPTWQKTTTSPIRSWISKVSNFWLKSCGAKYIFNFKYCKKTNLRCIRYLRNIFSCFSLSKSF